MRIVVIFKKMPWGKSFFEKEIGKIKAYKDAGISNRQIAKIIKRSHEGIANVIKMGSNYGIIKSPGRLLSITSRQIREIVQKAGVNHLSASEIKQYLGVNLSTRRFRKI